MTRASTLLLRDNTRLDLLIEPIGRYGASTLLLRQELASDCQDERKLAPYCYDKTRHDLLIEPIGHRAST
jgi:hypothetical protein